jgi:hypothetical protein
LWAKVCRHLASPEKRKLDNHHRHCERSNTFSVHPGRPHDLTAQNVQSCMIRSWAAPALNCLASLAMTAMGVFCAARCLHTVALVGGGSGWGVAAAASRKCRGSTKPDCPHPSPPPQGGRERARDRQQSLHPMALGDRGSGHGASIQIRSTETSAWAGRRLRRAYI